MSQRLNKRQRERLYIFKGLCNLFERRIRNRWGYECEDLTQEEVESCVEVMAEVQSKKGKPHEVIGYGETTFLVFCGLWHAVHAFTGSKAKRAARWLDRAREERSIRFLGTERCSALEEIGMEWLLERMRKRAEHDG